jgi:aspartyl-tRNA(Asn)/glutamyl-tRNA(Gln) amidotransferase subunit A
MAELHELTATEAAERIRSKTLSPVELVQALLARIERLEPRLRAWVTLDAEGAVSAAQEAEAVAAAGGEIGPLHGVPVALKDIYYTSGLPTTAGFPPLADFVPDRDAVSVQALRAAGAIVLGKTVTTQFAYADPPPTRNPWRDDRTPGGSSSGSAAAVAARMVPFAIGSQTAGSILRPAAYCGVVGFKPSYGRVSKRDVMPLAWSLDHVGPLARSVADVALVLQVLAGHDPADPGSADRPVPDYRAAATGGGRPPRFGLLPDMLERARPDVRAHGEEVVGRLAEAGAEIRDVRLPVSPDLLLAVHRVTMQAEAAAVHALGIAEQAEAYSPRIRAEAMVGQLIPAPAYLHAQRVRRRLREQVDALLGEVDALLLPTATNVAPPPDTTGDPSFQAPWSLLGLPSISLPSGLSDDGLPFGTQLVGARFAEATLLGAAGWCESVLAFDARPPDEATAGGRT